MTTNPVLVELWRGDAPSGGAVESAHRGALAIVDADGRDVLVLGDVERPVFPRSAVKALQALPLVESGAAERFGLVDAELALACASHGGEPAHVATAAAMLAKAGLDAAALECGAHWPLHEGAQRALAAQGATPGALHNNCSGKHAGFVCLGCLMAAQAGAEPRAWLRGYVEPEHPVMREVGAALGAITSTDLARAPCGTDGCSIPTFGIALRSLALGFARFGSGASLSPGRAAAAARLRGAVAAAPEMVAGSGRFDSVVMRRLGARAFVKVGAEGVYCGALPEAGLGIALKIDDGATARAAEVAMAAVLRALLLPQGEEAQWLDSLADVALRNWNRRPVGRLRATQALRGVLAPLAAA